MKRRELYHVSKGVLSLSGCRHAIQVKKDLSTQGPSVLPTQPLISTGNTHKARVTLATCVTIGYASTSMNWLIQEEQDGAEPHEAEKEQASGKFSVLWTPVSEQTPVDKPPRHGRVHGGHDRVLENLLIL